MITSSTPLNTDYGRFIVRHHRVGEEACLSVSLGHLAEPTEGGPSEPPMVRVHSACLFGESFAAQDCDCRAQLVASLSMIGAIGEGAVIYLFQEGRGAGIEQKIRAMGLQAAENINSYAAYDKLGLPRDGRGYAAAVGALRDLGLSGPLRLMSNNPLKRQALLDAGHDPVDPVPLSYSIHAETYEYLLMKHDEGHHVIDFGRLDLRS